MAFFGQELKGWIDAKSCPKCQSDNIYHSFNFESLHCIFCDDCRYLIKRREFQKAIEFWNNLKRKKSNQSLDADGSKESH